MDSIIDALNSKEFLELLPEYIQMFILIIGGIWAYWKFIYQRENEPATNLDIAVLFAGCQDDKWLIEVTAVLENKSLVRQTYRDQRLKIRYLLPNNEIKDGDNEQLHQQLNFPQSTTTLLNEEGHKMERYFVGVADTENRMNYINPKQRFNQRYITSVPKVATFIWVKVDFKFNQKNGYHTTTSSQRLFRVPECSESNYMTNYPIIAKS